MHLHTHIVAILSALNVMQYEYNTGLQCVICTWFKSVPLWLELWPKN